MRLKLCSPIYYFAIGLQGKTVYIGADDSIRNSPQGFCQGISPFYSIFLSNKNGEAVKLIEIFFKKFS